MNAADYTQFTRSTANDRTRANPEYLLMGLVAEVGELADARAKFIASKGDDDRWTSRDYTVKECGDILWFLTRVLDLYDSNLDEAIAVNMAKLQSRLEAGTLINRNIRREDPRSYGP